MRRRWVTALAVLVAVSTVATGGAALASPTAASVGADPARVVLNQAPFPPTDRSLFSPQVYGASATGPATTPQSDVQLRSQVLRVLAPRFVGAPQRLLAAVAALDDPALVAAVPDFRLRAAVVVLTRTDAEGALEVYRAQTFRRVTFGQITQNSSAFAISTPEPGFTQRSIIVNERYRLEDIRLLAAVLAHEGLHSDNSPSSPKEELVANALDSVVLAQSTIEDPGVASLRTELSRRLNTKLLALLNTRDDQGFIRIYTSRGNVYPGGAQTLTSFADAFGDYRTGLDTPGSPYLSRTIEQITGMRGARAFDQPTIDLLDRRVDNAFPARDWLRLAAALRLQLAPRGS